MPRLPNSHTAVNTELIDALNGGGRFLLIGAADTGKTTLAVRMARESGAWLLDSDVGQSEIGPPGLMDIAEPANDKPARDWKARAQWYVGAATPFASPVEMVTGARRLADRAAELGAAALVVDTPSFVNTPAGHTLARCLADVLCPVVVAIQRGEELERWLAGIGAPVLRLTADPAARAKTQPLRAGKRGERLAQHFKDATAHTVRLLETPLRGTRLGLGRPLTIADHRIASPLLGCPVLHAERGSSSVAFWTLGPPRHSLDRVAAEFGVKSAVTFDGSFWSGRSLGFIAPDGFCMTMGVVETVDWPSMTASVRAPLYSVAEAVAIHAGLIRHRPDGTLFPNVPDRDA